MSRVISQETFDEVVKENIEEFCMIPEEAIEDAIEQFKAQVLYYYKKKSKKDFIHFP